MLCNVYGNEEDGSFGVIVKFCNEGSEDGVCVCVCVCVCVGIGSGKDYVREALKRRDDYCNVYERERERERE